jgi:hypothetical protein
MRGEKPRGLAQRRKHSRRDWQVRDSLLDALNPHQCGGGLCGDREFRLKWHGTAPSEKKALPLFCR